MQGRFGYHPRAVLVQQPDGSTRTQQSGAVRFDAHIQNRRASTLEAVLYLVLFIDGTGITAGIYLVTIPAGGSVDLVLQQEVPQQQPGIITATTSIVESVGGELGQILDSVDSEVLGQVV